MNLNFAGLHEKHVAATRNLGTILAFILREGKTKKRVEIAGRRAFRMHIDFYPAVR
jgi:hypothetical protein